MKLPMVQEPKPEVSIYLIIEFYETTEGFYVYVHVRETIKNFQTSQRNQVTKKYAVNIKSGEYLRYFDDKPFCVQNKHLRLVIVF